MTGTGSEAAQNGQVRTKMKVEQRRIGELKPFARNARQHSPNQVAQLAASMREFGWTMPLLIKPDGELIAGHGRLLAAKDLGLDRVPVIVADGWSDAQCRAYVLADNQLALNASWDNLTLAEEIEGLKLEGFDLQLIGFDDAELSRLFLAPDALTLQRNEWTGMPEFNNGKIAFRDIILHFKDEAAVIAFGELLKQDIGENTKSLWFPAQPREIGADKRYVSDTSAEPK